MTDKRTHTSDCDWHVDQYPWECTCGFISRKKAMDDLIAQDADLIDKLRDEDSYYRLQEKHWCIDAEELERQRLAAADRIEALEAENERLRNMLKPQWFYHGDDQSSDQCRFSPYEVIDEDFFGWGERKKEGPHLVHISTAMPGPDIWAVVRVLTEEEMDARDDDEPWLIEEYDTEEEARAALAGDSHE